MLKTRIRHLPFPLLLSAASSILIGIALFSLILRSNASLHEFPLTEDGYYLLSVSRNIALGNGITIDGQRLTNGFQPLLAALLVPVYAFFQGDRYLSLRGVLAVHWLVHVATACLLGAIVRTSVRQYHPERGEVAFWATVFLWLASRYVFLNSYNGLETGCALLFYALAWRLYQRDWVQGWKLIGFGVVLGLLVLARIDAAIFVATLAGFEFFRRRLSAQDRIVRVVALALVPFVISLPWWLYNLVFFGSLMPSSGTSQTAPFSMARVEPMVRAVLQVFVPYIQVRWIEGLPQMALQALIAIAAVAFFIKTIYPHIRHSNTAHFSRVLLTSTAILCLYYLLSSGAPHFYGRYLTPFMLLSIPLAGLALANLPRFRGLATLGVVGPILLIAMVSIVGYHLQRGVSKSPFYNDQLQLIASYVPPTDVVGAAQSGTIGYFRDRVVNLDGKVNAEAIPYRDTMWVYLENEGITWFCDWSTTWLGPDPEANGWTPVGRRGQFVLYHRR